MTRSELIKSRERSIYLTEDELQLKKNHIKKFDFFTTKSPSVIGQFFVYEILYDLRNSKDSKYDTELTYPKLGIYVNSLPCDQTIEIEWIDIRRTCEWKLLYDYNHGITTSQSYLAESPTSIKTLPLWHDMMLVYGLWNSKPSWKEIRTAYQKTLWFSRETPELRDIKLNSLLV